MSERHHAYSISMLAVRRTTNADSADSPARIDFFISGSGYMIGHRSAVTCYSGPVSKEEAEKREMAKCRELYPEVEGWFAHQAAALGFDPETIKKKSSLLDRLFRTLRLR
jgi:hypothetical protein